MPFAMPDRPHKDVAIRAKKLLLLYEYENGHKFALDTGVGYKTWSRIENGWQRVSHAVWQKMARKCPGMAQEWLNWGTEEALPFDLRKRLARLPEPSWPPDDKRRPKRKS